MTDPDARRAEIAENLAQVRARIDQACRAAGRSPDEVVDGDQTTPEVPATGSLDRTGTEG